MMRWTLLLLVSVLTSCSAQWHLKKAIRKDPFILEKDTITVVDTIVTKPVVLKDTVVLKQIDTLQIVKDKLKIKVFRSFDTIRVDAVCDADTIVSVVEVPYEKIVYVEKDTPMQVVQRWLLYLLSIIAAFALWKLFFRKT